MLWSRGQSKPRQRGVSIGPATATSQLPVVSRVYKMAAAWDVQTVAPMQDGTTTRTTATALRSITPDVEATEIISTSTRTVWRSVPKVSATVYTY